MIRAESNVAPVGDDTVDAPKDATDALLEFLRNRDVACPRCDYNLRNAVSPNCPECGELVRLAVGLERPIMGALLLTIAPALGCGVCGVIFLVLFVILPGAPATVILMSLLLLLSGFFAIAVAVFRRRFLKQSRAVQATWAVISLGVQVLLVVLFISSLIYGR